MRKIYKKLTKEQKNRGVVFSSTLSKYTVETSEDTIHEVIRGEGEEARKIGLLKDDKFFRDSFWKYNIIRS